MKRLELTVHGLVQGISYRAFVERAARERYLFGRVQNLPDGSVRVVAEGEEGALRAFLAQLKEGYRFAKVEKIDEQWTEAVGSFSNFEIL